MTLVFHCIYLILISPVALTTPTIFVFVTSSSSARVISALSQTGELEAFLVAVVVGYGGLKITSKEFAALLGQPFPKPFKVSTSTPLSGANVSTFSS